MVPVTATVVGNPTVATSLVLDSSGSMSLASGLLGKTRMDVLHDSALLFVTLLDDTDAIGVVRGPVDGRFTRPAQMRASYAPLVDPVDLGFQCVSGSPTCSLPSGRGSTEGWFPSNR